MPESLLSTLSTDDRAVLSEFLTDALGADWWTQRKTLGFLLYLLGEKPAVEFTILSAQELDEAESAVLADEIPPEDACQGFLALVAKLDVPHHRRCVALNGGFTAVYYECVTTENRPIPAPQADGNTAEFHREWGDHYGYPESAIEGFVSDECLRIYTLSEDATELRQRADGFTASWSDVRRLALVSFVPPASDKGLAEAIQRGQHYEAVLREAAEQYGCPPIGHLVDHVLSEFDGQLADDGPH